MYMYMYLLQQLTSSEGMALFIVVWVVMVIEIVTCDVIPVVTLAVGGGACVHLQLGVGPTTSAGPQPILWEGGREGRG